MMGPLRQLTRPVPPKGPGIATAASIPRVARPRRRVSRTASSIHRLTMPSRWKQSRPFALNSNLRV